MNDIQSLKPMENLPFIDFFNDFTSFFSFSDTLFLKLRLIVIITI
jgi:hypothetical protein